MDFAKEWGMKRAANEAEQTHQEQKEQAKMTRQSNGAGAALSATNVGATKVTPAKKETAAAPEAPNPMQVVRLLHDLGDRLRRSEAEREALWRELERTQKFLSEIQDHSSKAEKAFLSLESQISRREQLTQDILNRQAKIEEIQKEQADLLSADREAVAKNNSRLDNLETTAGSALVRIEDALNESNKLSRRLELVSQDKARLLRKIEAMEETLTLTQDTLKAKALVLLTDQAIATRTPLPQQPAITQPDTDRIAAVVQASLGPKPRLREERTTQPWLANLFTGENAFWRKLSNTTAIALIPVIGLALAAGWGINQMQSTSLPPISVDRDGQISQYDTGKNAWEPVAASAPKKATDVSDLDALAKQAAIDPSILNDIEPGALTEDEQATGAPADITSAFADPAIAQEYAKAQADEQKAITTFTSSREETPVVDRIKADVNLPGVVKDVEAKALEGNAEAQHDLAAIYTAGHANVKANYSRAATWFREAALNGVANAQYNLGVLYHQGLGVKQNTAEAITLYRVAASQNHPEAQYNLGIAHIEGVGAEYNPQRAAAYFEKAAQGGIVEAAYNLGLVHENGLLGEAHPEEALFWYQEASDEGNPQAKEALEQLAKQMDLTPDAVKKITDKMAITHQGLAKGKTAVKVDSPAIAPAAPAKAKAEPAQSPAAPEEAKAEPAPVKKPAKIASLYDPVIVAQIQEQLVQLGLYPGPADGETNPLTEDAVRSYQTMNDMKPDGRPTEDILVHMLAREMQMDNSIIGKSRSAEESLNN